MQIEITLASVMFLTSVGVVMALVIVPIEIKILEKLFPLKGMTTTQHHSWMYSMYRNSVVSDKL